ncbi:MAG: sulfatase [Verrucomicrobiales bacterium]|nr:sulfatase [Verrucomicrobiales bacterium]
MNILTLIRTLGCFVAFSAIVTGKMLAESSQHPNVVIIFLDDSGYGDFHPFGTPSYSTPNVEKLAAEGMRLNKFYVPQAICSASRSALLSGCFPGRTKVFGAHGPNGRGLDRKFMTMAEMFKENGYATAHFGKWHCGDTPQTRPLARGFNEHAGLMYSNDMWKHHPKDPEYWGKHPLQYWENGRIKIKEVSKKDQTQLTTWSTEYAVDFIHRNSKTPFFLYLAHSMPHVPIFCSDKFLGKSGAGLYGDVIMELDWSVGEVMKAIRKAGVEKNTIIIFSSDNGPWSEYGNHAGVTPFREHKTTSFDGGIRSATIMKYPEQITGGSEMNRVIGSIDLLPTLAHLTGTPLPTNEIDGKNVWPLISGSKDAENPHDYYPFSSGRDFEAVISSDGRWKLHLPHKYRHALEAGKDGMPGRISWPMIELSLFDLENDPSESRNLINKYPEIAAKLNVYAEKHKKRFYE